MSSHDQFNPYAPPLTETADTDGGTAAITEPASRLKRLVAWLLDAVVQAAICGAPLLLGTDFSALGRGFVAEDIGAVLRAMSPAALSGVLIGLLIWIVWTTYLVAQNGQTPGRKLVGVKVVRADGSRASLARIFWLRNIANALPALLPVVGNLYLPLDSAFICGDTRRCLHDRIAGTSVVNA